MSLLDDVSIVVTPNGYKAGELYAVVPVPTEGAEEGANMDFSSGTSPWALNSNWSLGGVGVIADGTSNSTIWQSAVVEDNKQYIVTYTLTDFLQGSINVDLSGGNGITRTLADTYTEVITSGTSPTTRLSFEGSGNFKVTLSNVIVKEYTAADMDVTRATAATRVDEDGLVNYAEVLGDDMITDGNFSSSVDWQEQDASNTIAGNQALWTASPHGKGFKGFNANDNIFTAGKTYRITYTIDSITSGEVRIRYPFIGTTYDSTGTYPLTVTETGVALSGGGVDLFMQNLNSTTAAISNIIAKEVTRDNVPRIDYTGGGCPHILSEPERTNIVPYSEDFTQWTDSSLTVADDEAISPDGTQNADKVTASLGGSIYLNFTCTASTDYTFSFYVKDIDFVNNALAIYDNTTPGFIDSDVLYTPTSEWSRITHSFTTPAGCISLRVYPQRKSNGENSKYIWGAQVEEGSYATSYIPNFGEAAGVTRNQDIFTRDGISSLINSTEGVLFVEIAALSDDLTYREISLSDGTTTNRVEIRYGSNSNKINAIIRNGSYVLLQYTVSSIVDFNKIAFKWKTGDFALWINGVEVRTDTTAFVTSGLNRLAFDQGTTGNTFFGKVKQLQVYDTALTDEQLLQLTGESGTDFYESYAEMASALTYTIQ